MEEQLNIKTKELEDLQAEFDEFTESSQELEKELESSLQNAEKRASEASAALSRLQVQFENTTEQYKSASRQINTLQGELESTKGHSEALEKEKRRLEQSTDELESNVRILQATEADLQHKLDRAIEDKVFLQTDHSELENEHQMITERLRSEIADLQSEIFVLKARNQDVNEKENISEASEESKLRSREELIDSLEEEVDFLTHRLKEEEERRDQLETQCAQLKRVASDFSEMERTIQEMTKQLEGKSNQIDELANQVEEYKTQLSSAQEKLRMAQLNQPTTTLVNHSNDELIEKCEKQRKRNVQLLSRIQSVSGKIQVFCRVRPLPVKAALDEVPIINAVSETEVVLTEGISNVSNDGAKDYRTYRSFKFDRVFDPNESQQEIFDEIEPLALSVVNGYNVCVMAYGPTGSGKTYTMLGPEEDPGVSIRLVQRVFEEANSVGTIMSSNSVTNDVLGELDGVRFQISMSMIEIYNEEIRDLLVEETETPSTQKLAIRYNSNDGGITIPNLTTCPLDGPSDFLKAFYRGDAIRATASTDINEHSSRSHSIVILDIVKCTDSRTGSGNIVHSASSTRGKLYLVDLAGSERVRRSAVQGEQLKEAQYINKSLSALGDVMEALDKKKTHVPYRNSKLTYLLQDCLGGNSKTLMILASCPMQEYSSESLFSLQFATRVRNVELGMAHKNSFLTTVKAQEEITQLRSELKAMTQRKLKAEQALSLRKREQKKGVEKMSNAFSSHTRQYEDVIENFKAQNASLKKDNHTLSEEMKEMRVQIRDNTKTREGLEREIQIMQSRDNAHQRQVGLLEGQLTGRIDEIKKLRSMLQQARRRSTANFAPRPSRSKGPEEPLNESETTIMPKPSDIGMGAQREPVRKVGAHLRPPSRIRSALTKPFSSSTKRSSDNSTTSTSASSRRRWH